MQYVEIRCADCGCLPGDCAKNRAGLSNECPDCRYEKCCCAKD